MSILIGVNHIATVSRDLDNLISFYDRIFDAKVLVDIEIPDMVLKSDPAPGLHVFISIGGPSILHAWQIAGVDPVLGLTARFSTGAASITSRCRPAAIPTSRSCGSDS